MTRTAARKPSTPGDPVDDTGTGGRADHDGSTPTIEDAAPGTDDDGAVDRADTGTGSTPGTPPEAAPDLDAVTPDAANADADPDLASTSEPDRVDADDSDDGEDLIAAPVTAGRGPRLAPGALHGLVEDYLRDHPDGEFGPTKIGHELGRSTGAVGNALERLVTAGYAVRTNDRPKRYTLAPAATADRDTARDSSA